MKYPVSVSEPVSAWSDSISIYFNFICTEVISSHLHIVRFHQNRSICSRWRGKTPLNVRNQTQAGCSWEEETKKTNRQQDVAVEPVAAKWLELWIRGFWIIGFVCLKLHLPLVPCWPLYLVCLYSVYI